MSCSSPFVHRLPRCPPPLCPCSSHARIGTFRPSRTLTAAVIISSVLVFGNPLTTTNKIGTAIALIGVGFYSQVKRWKPKAKAAGAGTADATA